MRLIPVIAAVFSLFVSCPSFAQGWSEYASPEDLFTVNFLGAPEVQDITYQTEYAVTLPGRVHSYEDGPNRYSVTVVDYTDVEERHREQVASCRAAGRDGDSCLNRAELELHGAMDHATWNLLQRAAEVTHLVYYEVDRIAGRSLHLTNPDGSRTFAAINMHENRLYILEGHVSADSPPPLVFQQSLGFLDQERRRVRYASTYSNGFPAPARTR